MVQTTQKDIRHKIWIFRSWGERLSLDSTGVLRLCCYIGRDNHSEHITKDLNQSLHITVLIRLSPDLRSVNRHIQNQ